MPIAAVAIWLIIVRGSYRSAERIFIWLTIPFFAYPIAAILAHPDWGDVGKAIVDAAHPRRTRPTCCCSIATAGTTITPYMQLYLQSAVVERGVREDELPHEEREAVAGAVFANLIAALHHHRHRRHAVHPRRSTTSTRPPRPRARSSPFAGQLRRGAVRRSGCSARACSPCAILPIATSYVVSESLGYEKGVGRRREEAPVFVGVITAMIAISDDRRDHPRRAGDLAAGRRAGRQRAAAADQPVLHLAALALRAA